MSPIQADNFTHSDADNPNHMKEWEIARDVLKSFDDHLHDLRKFGFSFFTALIAADGILFNTSVQTANITIKFAVFGVTLLLIQAVQLIDRNYVVFQKAAATRAIVLERELNLELSEIISVRFRNYRINRIVQGIYVIFSLCVLWLGYLSMNKEIGYTLTLVAIAFLSTWIADALNLTFASDYQGDWTISPLSCSRGGKILITLNNLKSFKGDKNPVEIILTKLFQIKKPDTEPIHFIKGQLIFKIINKETGRVIERIAKDDMDVFGSYTWIVKADEFGEDGIYQLQPKDRLPPLDRRILISGMPLKRKRRNK